MKRAHFIVTTLLACSLMTLNAYAKNHHDNGKANKMAKQKKQKNLPRGLQKKLHRGGELPRGWEKKLSVGEVLSPMVLQNAVEVDKYEYYNKDITKSPREKIYQVEDKIIKVMAATNIILDIFEVK